MAGDDRKPPAKTKMQCEAEDRTNRSGTPKRPRNDDAIASSPKRKSTRGTKKRAPDMPKRPLSGYNFFFREMRNVVLAERDSREEDARRAGVADVAELNKERGPNMFAKLGKVVAQRWKSLDEEGKTKYEEMSRADSERYRKEMDQYNANQQAKRRRLQEEGAKLPSSNTDPSGVLNISDRSALSMLSPGKTKVAAGSQMFPQQSAPSSFQPQPTNPGFHFGQLMIAEATPPISSDLLGRLLVSNAGMAATQPSQAPGSVIHPQFASLLGGNASMYLLLQGQGTGLGGSGGVPPALLAMYQQQAAEAQQMRQMLDILNATQTPAPVDSSVLLESRLLQRVNAVTNNAESPPTDETPSSSDVSSTSKNGKDFVA